MAIKPIFLFSVSRSGSTLLQRIVAAHPGVATTSEPWLLLPQAYAFRRTGVRAEYLHHVMVDAIGDFCEQLPGGSDEYRRELRACMLRLYERAAGEGASHFVDKSPPYCFAAQEIMDLFPEGKFVFLWRNPLSVVASIIQTWESWRPTLFREELFAGLPRLVAAYEANRWRAWSVRFEDLLGAEERHWRPLMDYLGLPYDPRALERFSEVKLNGRMGDPTGVRRYASLSGEPTDKWKRALANPLRREWSRRYLAFLGESRLATMGYDAALLRDELDALPTSTEALGRDLARLLGDVAKEPIRVRMRSQGLGGPNVIRRLLAV